MFSGLPNTAARRKWLFAVLAFFLLVIGCCDCDVTSEGLDHVTVLKRVVVKMPVEDYVAPASDEKPVYDSDEQLDDADDHVTEVNEDDFDDIIDEESTDGAEEVPLRRHRRDTSPYDVTRKIYVRADVVVDGGVWKDKGKQNMTRLREYVWVNFDALNRILAQLQLPVTIQVVVSNIKVETEDPGLNSVTDEGITKMFEHFKDYSYPTDSDVQLLIAKDQQFNNIVGRASMGICSGGNKSRGQGKMAVFDIDANLLPILIAHEFGHVLGVLHVTDRDVCGDMAVPDDAMAKDRLVNVMERIVYGGLKISQAWSTCALRQLDVIIRQGGLDCLMNRTMPQPGFPRTRPKQLVGQFYSRDEQCQLAGEGDYAMKGRHDEEQCNYLTCIAKHDRSMRAYIHHTRWADGTPCDTARGRGHCVDGKCKRVRRAVDGQWSKWSKWGACSRACDGGIKISRRKCNRPRPAHGGARCRGATFRYKSCMRRSCSRVGISSAIGRQAQCALYGRQGGLESRVVWLGTKSIDSQCKLQCNLRQDGLLRGSVSQFYAKDGTPCMMRSAGSHVVEQVGLMEARADGRCVRGVCERSGCDGKMWWESKRLRQLNKCGICPSTSPFSSQLPCRKVKRTKVIKSLSSGTWDVVSFPAGANNIVVMQTDWHPDYYDKTWLRIVDGEGRCYVGCSRFQQEPITLVHDTFFTYLGFHQQTETLESDHPLRIPLTLQIVRTHGERDPRRALRVLYSFYTTTPRMEATIV